MTLRTLDCKVNRARTSGAVIAGRTYCHILRNIASWCDNAVRRVSSALNENGFVAECGDRNFCCGAFRTVEELSAGVSTARLRILVWICSKTAERATNRCRAESTSWTLLREHRNFRGSFDGTVVTKRAPSAGKSASVRVETFCTGHRVFIRLQTAEASRAEIAVKRIHSVVVVVSVGALKGRRHRHVRAVFSNAASSALVYIRET